jgi:hypothetical protein
MLLIAKAISSVKLVKLKLPLAVFDLESLKS